MASFWGWAEDQGSRATQMVSHASAAVRNGTADAAQASAWIVWLEDHFGYEWQLTLATIALVLATIALVVVTFLLVGATRDLRESATKDAEATIKAENLRETFAITKDWNSGDLSKPQQRFRKYVPPGDSKHYPKACVDAYARSNPIFRHHLLTLLNHLDLVAMGYHRESLDKEAIRHFYGTILIFFHGSFREYIQGARTAPTDMLPAGRLSGSGAAWYYLDEVGQELTKEAQVKVFPPGCLDGSGHASHGPEQSERARSRRVVKRPKPRSSSLRRKP